MPGVCIFKIISRLVILVFLNISPFVFTKAQYINLTIYLRGVYESKISLLPLADLNSYEPLAVIDSVKNGDTALIKISTVSLPGEFVLRFDYKEDAASTPYPSEKRIIINNQDIHLWAHPVFSNSSDSTWFQEDEKENKAYFNFLKESGDQKKMLILIQDFLLNYNDINSDFYKEGISEYEKRRNSFNQWISIQVKQNKRLFASSLFSFHYVPKINWNGSETDRKQSLRDDYLNAIDFNDPFILNTS